MNQLSLCCLEGGNNKKYTIPGTSRKGYVEEVVLYDLRREGARVEITGGEFWWRFARILSLSEPWHWPWSVEHSSKRHPPKNNDALYKAFLERLQRSDNLYAKLHNKTTNSTLLGRYTVRGIEAHFEEVAQFVGYTFTTPQIVGVLDWVYRNNHAGLPDLVADFSTHSRFSPYGHTLVEVKGPGDRLSRKQKACITFIEEQTNLESMVISASYKP